MRAAHVLRETRRASSPARCIWVDTETHPLMVDVLQDKHVLTFGWAVYRRRSRAGKWSSPEWFRFETRDEFWDWALGKCPGNAKLSMFAHNVSFDAPVLGAFSELPARGFRLESAIIESPPTILRWRQRAARWRSPIKPGTWRLRSPRGKVTRTIEWVDTLNIWRMPLARLGESMDLPKLVMPSPDASREAWDRYGRRDTEIIMMASLRWWDWLRDNDLGAAKPTLAGQAFTAYRKRFLTPGIFIDDNAEALSLARRALHGGRTECWRLGRVQGPVHVVDVNSMYPAIMRAMPMPMRLISVLKHATPAEIGHWCVNRCVVADVDVDTDQPAYGVVHEGRLVFPVGRFRTALTTPELAYAVRYGHVAAVHRVALYSSGVLFRSYVDFFYRARLEARARGDSVSELSCKLLANSLFGKFGQAGRVYESIGEADEALCLQWEHVDAETGRQTKLRALGGLVQGWRPEGESLHSHPAIAAHVTAYGRMQWWDLALQAGRQHVVYGDTDSLMVTAEGLRRLRPLLNPTALGMLKLEQTWEWVELHGPKDYRWPGGAKIKGVRHNAGWVSPDTVYQSRFSGLKGLVQAGSLDAPVVSIQQKTLARRYKKGRAAAGGEVLPLRLGYGQAPVDGTGYG